MAKHTNVAAMKKALLTMTPADLKESIEHLRMSIVRAGKDTNSIAICRDMIEKLREQSAVLGFPLPGVAVTAATPEQEMARLVAENAKLTAQVASLQEVVKTQEEKIGAMVGEPPKPESQTMDEIGPLVGDATVSEAEYPEPRPPAESAPEPDDGYVGQEPLDDEEPEPSEPEKWATVDRPLSEADIKKGLDSLGGAPHPVTIDPATSGEHVVSPPTAATDVLDTSSNTVAPVIVATGHAHDLAGMQGIDLKDVSYAGSKITKADVQAHIESLQPAQAE